MSTILKIVGGIVIVMISLGAGLFGLAYGQSPGRISFAEAFSRGLVEGSYSDKTFCSNIADGTGKTEQAIRQLMLQIGKPISYGAGSLGGIHFSDVGRRFQVMIPVQFENYDAKLEVVIGDNGGRGCIAGWHVLDVKSRGRQTVRS